MAALFKIFTSCRQATASKIPKKNKTLGTSVFEMACDTENYSLSKLLLRL